MKKILLFFFGMLLLTTVIVNAQQRKVLFEQFTSSTCGPCATMNNWLTPLLVNNAEKVIVVKYQMNWPAPGDPYYTAEGGTRRSYYAVNSVPYPFTNGVYTNTQSAIQNAINNGYAQPAEANITGYFRVSGNMIYLKTSVTPLITGSNYVVHCVVNEKSTTGNKMNNGESIFHHVMMKMFPNGNGTTLSLTEGETIHFNFSHDMSTTKVEEMSDLEVAVFVQNKSTKAVLNAEYLTESSTLPLPPTNFTAVQQGESLNINLSWDVISGVSGYNIYRDGIKVNSTPITGTTYIDAVSEYGVTYKYSIHAISGGVEGFEGKTTCQTQLTLPQPINVTVKQIRGMKMNVTWEMPAGFTHPVKYNVYRNNILQNSGNPLSVTNFESIGTSYTEYCFEIAPLLNEITGAKSPQSCITLVYVPTPENVTAQQVAPTKKSVRLTWDPSTTNTAGYNVYRDNVKINTELVTEPNYLDLVSEFDKEYTYLVYGVAENGGESTNAGTAKITLTTEMPIPKNVKANQPHNNQLSVTVSWDKIPMEIGYNIYRNEAKINNDIVTENEYVDIVPEESNYCYKISVASDDVESEKSESACVDVVLGINEPAQDIFTLYPNPVSGKLFINSDETILNCNVYNLQGQLIYSSKLDIREIDTDGWAQNVYIIQITTHKGLSEKRFVKR